MISCCYVEVMNSIVEHTNLSGTNVAFFHQLVKQLPSNNSNMEARICAGKIPYSHFHFKIYTQTRQLLRLIAVAAEMVTNLPK